MIINHNDAMLPQADAKKLLINCFEHLADWPMRSTEAFRNACLGLGSSMFAVNPLLPVRKQIEATFLQDMIKLTVAEGRMIDFGRIPNSVIKEEALRTRHMFEAGEFQHPYENWLAVTTWEGGFNGYHISPHPIREGETLVLELYGVSHAHAKPLDIILVYDIVSIKVVQAPTGNSTLVFPMEMDSTEKQTEHEVRLRGSNSLEPLVTMLRILHDNSIAVSHSPAPERLNRQRVKQGKPPIPDHMIVHTRDYVAQFTAHKAASVASGVQRSHASPVAHWRRAHLRHLMDGRVVPVKSSKVNWRDTEELHRLFYRVKETP